VLVVLFVAPQNNWLLVDISLLIPLMSFVFLHLLSYLRTHFCFINRILLSFLLLLLVKTNLPLHRVSWIFLSTSRYFTAWLLITVPAISFMSYWARLWRAWNSLERSCSYFSMTLSYSSSAKTSRSRSFSFQLAACLFISLSIRILLK